MVASQSSTEPEKPSPEKSSRDSLVSIQAGMSALNSSREAGASAQAMMYEPPARTSTPCIPDRFDAGRMSSLSVEKTLCSPPLPVRVLQVSPSGRPRDLIDAKPSFPFLRSTSSTNRPEPPAQMPT